MKYLVAGFYIPYKLKVQLYDETLNQNEFIKILKMLDPKKDRIVFHGPDIGHLEKLFKVNIRDYFKCLNIQKVLKRCTRRKKIGLKHLEKEFGIKRKFRVLEHHEIRRFWGYGGKKKAHVLGYNMEDIVNLYRLKSALCKKYNITPAMLDKLSILPHNTTSRKASKKYINILKN